MKDSITRKLEGAVQKTCEWLLDVETAMETIDRPTAYHALRAVLHALRDRLAPEEAADLASELPVLIRGIFYEGWSPAHKPEKLSREEFLERIMDETSASPWEFDPEKAACAVFAVLQKRISSGEIRDIQGALPRKFEELWIRG